MNIDLKFETLPRALDFYMGMRRAWILLRTREAEMPLDESGHEARGVVWLGLLNAYCVRNGMEIKGVELRRAESTIWVETVSTLYRRR